MQYIRGRRAYLNMIRDPIDNYIEHKDEIEEVLKSYTKVLHKPLINEKQQIYISSAWQDKNYVRCVEVCKGSKIYGTDKDDLYELDKELNEPGFKTRIDRNCDTGTLSVMILDEPENKLTKGD